MLKYVADRMIYELLFMNTKDATMNQQLTTSSQKLPSGPITPQSGTSTNN